MDGGSTVSIVDDRYNISVSIVACSLELTK